MKNLLLAVALILSLSQVSAQNAVEGSCVEEAQVWYDAIDGDGLVEAYHTILDRSARLTAKVAAINQIETIIDEARLHDYPDCIRVARQYYLDGMTALNESLYALLDEDLPEWFDTSLYAAQHIGEARGYLNALGIEIEEVPGVRFYLK